MDTKFCPNCGSKVPKNSKFCQNCGHHFVKRPKNKCPNCGAKITPQMNFCNNCGYDLHKNNVHNNNQPQNNSISSRPEQPNSVQRNYQYNNQDISTTSRDQMHNGEISADVNQTSNTKKAWIVREFSQSFLFFWIKGRIAVNEREVNLDIPNSTFFGLIPAGKSHRDFSIASISTPGVDTSYKASDFIIGFFIALIGLSTITASPVVGLILLILGVAVFTNGIQTSFSIDNGSGADYSFSVPFFNRTDMELVASTIHKALNDRQDQTDLRNLNTWRH